MNDTIHRFKKDDPEYKQKRHKHLIELTKQRYRDDEAFRNKCRETSRAYYQKLKSLATSNSSNT